MTLRLKINLIVGALTLLFMLAVMGLLWRSMKDSVHEEVVAANRVAAQMLNRTAWRFALQGTPAMLAFLQSVGRVRSNDISLLDESGRELYRSPPSPYKAGRDAPAWFDRLIAPQPAMQTINLPDGKLLVQANASRAVLDAWDDLATLAGLVLLLLLASNLLVFWLVGRAVRPFAQIVSALDGLQAGNFKLLLPALPGREAAAMGAAFNRSVQQLKSHIETERRAVRAEEKLTDSRELTRWLDQHVENERRLIARELHDEFGQSVTAMRSMALSIAQRVGSVDAESEKAARLIADESSRLYDAMHGIIPRLTPLVLDSLGLADALHDLVERTRRSQPGLMIEWTLELEQTVLPTDVALALYRSAQEGLTNAIRHGQARHISLSVQAQADAVSLRLLDDGVGLPAHPAPRSGHFGLRWLRERLESLGGTLELLPVQPHGALLQASLPLSKATT